MYRFRLPPDKISGDFNLRNIEMTLSAIDDQIPVKPTVPAAFTASERVYVGMEFGSTVADAYAERRPLSVGP